MKHEALKKQLVRHEGFVLHEYQDSEGYSTIGVGRMIDRKLGGGISTDEAMLLLENDIKKVEQQLDDWLSWWRKKPENIKLVLIDMCFNLGIHGLLSFKKFLTALQKGDMNTAKIEMADSLWNEQVGQRAIDLQEML